MALSGKTIQWSGGNSVLLPVKYLKLLVNMTGLRRDNCWRGAICAFGHILETKLDKKDL